MPDMKSRAMLAKKFVFRWLMMSAVSVKHKNVWTAAVVHGNVAKRVSKGEVRFARVQRWLVRTLKSRRQPAPIAAVQLITVVVPKLVPNRI
jgi:hypothetical protein